MEEVPVTKAGESLFDAVPINFLYKVLVSARVSVEEEVFVYGTTTMISAAGDLVIQNANGQRVFGASVGEWFGFYIVDQETYYPVSEFFVEVEYD